MNNNGELHSALWNHLSKSIPRVLTQMDRDPDSPTFGCFDRDFWHYKIRDFSSIVLQQGTLILQTLHDYSHPDNYLYNDPTVLTWVDASLEFWASRQLPSGSFEEYYPHEEGYPPTAFSLYAVVLVYQMRGFPELGPAMMKAVQAAVDWILQVQEKEALNQEAVGLTAVTLASHIPGITVDMPGLEKRLAEFFAARSPEGWFPEYGGADTGYLSVTIDSLYSYFELTGDERAEEALKKALFFLSSMVSVSGARPVMTNSRNTDYIVPFGLVRMAEQDPLAKRVVETVFGGVGLQDHFLNATDDRYLCHYVYHSCFRALSHIDKMTSAQCRLPSEQGAEIFYPEAGIHVQHVAGERSIFTAAFKGGVVYVFQPEGLLFADFGWRHLRGDGRVALTHWQNRERSVTLSSEEGPTVLSLHGDVTLHGWPESTVLRHGALRALSYLFGRRIIAWLKRSMIFNAAKSGIRFKRVITLSRGDIAIVDTFTGDGLTTFKPVPAPAYSLRHVASAANFTREELLEHRSVDRIVERSNGQIRIDTRLSLGDARVPGNGA